MVPSVEDIFRGWLVSDVLQPDTVAEAADMTHNITIGTRSVWLQLGNAVVEPHLLSTHLRAPPALAVIQPRLASCVMVSAVL